MFQAFTLKMKLIKVKDRELDKAYKVVRCASIMFMDISMNIHIHGKPDLLAFSVRHIYLFKGRGRMFIVQ